MQSRLPQRRVNELMPVTIKSLLAISASATAGGLEAPLVELVKTRASQINGCAFCLEMHTREARAAGESEARLHLLNAWRESPLYSERERAALAWTEALTLITDGHAPDDVYESVRAQFDEPQLAALTSTIVAINAWNRIAIAYRYVHPVAAAKAA